MRLVDLDPRWIHPNVFMFWCPHCRKVRLTCKNVIMPFPMQHELWQKEFGDNWKVIVGCEPDMAWAFSNEHDFATTSVTPSVDASKSGHWHGYITNGTIV